MSTPAKGKGRAPSSELTPVRSTPAADTGSSPHSESTPATTIFTPAGHLLGRGHGSGPGAHRRDTQLPTIVASTSFDDLTGFHQALSSILKPTASAFTPSGSRVNNNNSSNLSSNPVGQGAASFMSATAVRPVVAGMKPSIAGVNDGAGSRPFTNESDSLTRYLFIKGAPVYAQHLLDDEIYSTHLNTAVHVKLTVDGVVLRFDDLRAAKTAFEAVQASLEDYRYANAAQSVRFILGSAYKGLFNNADEIKGFDPMEGNLFFCINRDGHGLTTDTLRNMALEEAGRFGNVYAFKKMGDTPQRIVMRVEFYSVRIADCVHNVYSKGGNCSSNPACYLIATKSYDEALTIAIQRGPVAAVNAHNISSTLVRSNGTGAVSAAAVGLAPAFVGTAYHAEAPAVQPYPLSYPAMQPFQPRGLAYDGQQSMPYSAPAVASMVPRPMLFDPVFDNRMYRRKYTHHTNPVDCVKIMRGEDVRTTVMLRNVPNKMDVHELKDIIDTTSLGKYDFSYLRIDFKNACNVGYAFINFTRPEHIIPFIREHQNRPWNLYNSDKIAEVSYATRQGIHCLIDAFRNSCVMEEHPDHRPKLWFTDEDGEHLCGKEKPFPPPNNMAKLQRSRANAETVGLFPPRAARGLLQYANQGYAHFDNGPRATIVPAGYHFGNPSVPNAVGGGYGGQAPGVGLNGATALPDNNNWQPQTHAALNGGTLTVNPTYGTANGPASVYAFNTTAIGASAPVPLSVDNGYGLNHNAGAQNGINLLSSAHDDYRFGQAGRGSYNNGNHFGIADTDVDIGDNTRTTGNGSNGRVDINGLNGVRYTTVAQTSGSLY